MLMILSFSFFFFNDTATTEIYTLSLHDALPICVVGPFRGFDIAPEHREFISSVLELEQSRALRRHRFREIRLALATLARGARDSLRDFLHFSVEFLAQAPVLGELTLVLWVVAAALSGQFA